MSKPKFIKLKTWYHDVIEDEHRHLVYDNKEPQEIAVAIKAISQVYVKFALAKSTNPEEETELSVDPDAFEVKEFVFVKTKPGYGTSHYVAEFDQNLLFDDKET